MENRSSSFFFLRTTRQASVMMRANPRIGIILDLFVFPSLTRRKFSEAQILHGTRGNQGFLWIKQHMCQCVHPYVEIRDVNAHSLLAHSTLK